MKRHLAFWVLGFLKGGSFPRSSLYSRVRASQWILLGALFLSTTIYLLDKRDDRDDEGTVSMPMYLQEEYTDYYIFEYPACPSHSGMMTSLEYRTKRLLAKEMWMIFGKQGKAFIDIVGDCRILNDSEEEWRIEKWRLVIFGYDDRGRLSERACRPYVGESTKSSRWISLDNALQDFETILKELFEEFPRFSNWNLCQPKEKIDYAPFALEKRE